MKSRMYGLGLVSALLGVWVTAAVAAPAPGTTAGAAPRWVAKQPAKRTQLQRELRTTVFNQSRRIDVNNINMFVTNYGTFANDIENNGNSGLFFPKGTIKTAVYQSGPWLVGKVNGEVRAAIGEYSQEYEPGAMIGTAPDNPSDPRYTVYKVVRYAGSPSDTDHVERAPAAIARDRTLDPIAHHSWSEYVNGAGPSGAPVREYRFPTGAPGDSVTVLGPDMKGDQMLWCVYNDASPSAHNNRAGRSAPLGVEIQQTTFAFDRQGALGNTVFLEFKITNKGGNAIDSLYINLWSDPDLGGAGDDLVGCDTTLSLGYIYNATNTDQLYSDRPPAVGYDFFQGPRVGSQTLPLTAFIYYINGTDPQSADQSFNYMKGLQRDGTPFIDPTTGGVTKFYASGDPVAGTGYLDTNPSDRRFMLISGPFSMAPGETQTIVGAIIVAQGGDRLSSITGLKFFDVKAQTAFDIKFDLPPPPPPPRVAYSSDHGRVNLLWDSGSRFNYTPAPGWEFEGYNVYQGASISGPWKRLKTFDLVNTIKDVRDTVFDVNSGLIVNDTPTAFGGDNGVQYTFGADQDAIRGGKLKDGTIYYFAVTAYSVNQNPPQGFEKVLETSFQPVVVTIQRPALGTDIAAAQVNGSEVHRASTATPPTTDHVNVEVVDPASITGHTYEITYSPITGGGHSWNLTDRNTGQTLISNQAERTDSPEYAPVDGMIVRLRESQAADPPNDPLNDIYYTPFDTDNPFSGVHAGLGYFEDSFGYAFNFFAGIDPTVSPEAFPSMELRFGAGQKAYRFFRDETASGGAPTAGRGYTYGGLGDAPFQAWDIDSDQQLSVAFVERRVTDAASVPVAAQLATHDGIWNPDNSDLGGREYLFISKRPYSASGIPELAQDGAVLGADTLWLYAAWLLRPGTVKTGDKFVIRSGGNRTGTANDTLVFSTQGAARNVVALQKSGLENIRVVPNPYYSRSTYEISSFNRIVKFINMPEQATVRIFNLAGQLVRTLRKTDGAGSILEWNLENENRLPIASGIYVYQVEVPGAGSTAGRLVVFMEKERLQNF